MSAKFWPRGQSMSDAASSWVTERPSWVIESDDHSPDESDDHSSDQLASLLSRARSTNVDLKGVLLALVEREAALGSPSEPVQDRVAWVVQNECDRARIRQLVDVYSSPETLERVLRRARQTSDMSPLANMRKVRDLAIRNRSLCTCRLATTGAADSHVQPIGVFVGV
eukprot:6885158-Prymnesium_polylepis.1